MGQGGELWFGMKTKRERKLNRALLIYLQVVKVRERKSTKAGAEMEVEGNSEVS